MTTPGGAIELAQIWVPLMPESSRLSAGVERIGRDVEKRFGSATKTMGSQLASNVASAAKKAQDALKAVERQTDTLAKARARDADALGRVNVAQARLNELTSRSRTSASQRASAEEAVARAQRAQEISASNLSKQTRELNRLQTTSNRLAREAAAAQTGRTQRISWAIPTVEAEASGVSTGERFVMGFRRILGLGAATLAAGTFVSQVRDIVSLGLDFDSSLNTMQGVTRASGEQMEAARQAAAALGSDTELAGVSASDAAQAMTELAKGGFDVEQSMEAARGTLQLATAAQVDAAQAAQIQADALHTFQLPVSEASRVADLLAGAANASTGSIEDFALGLSQAGPVAAGFGVSIEDTLTSLAMFANFGIKGSDAGTLMKTSLQAITDQGNPAQGAIDELGLSLYDANEQFIGYPEMLKQVAEASTRMSEEQFQAATNVLFGSDAMRASMIAAKAQEGTFDDLAAAVTRPGNAADMAKAQMQGLPGVMESLRNTAEGAKIELYELAKPMLESSGTTVVGWLQDATAAIRELKDSGGGEAMERIRQGWQDISGVAERLAPALGSAAAAIGTGVGTIAVAGWEALAGALQLVEPPLRLVANVLGDNQWLTTGAIATLGALYAKSKLLGPTMEAAATATSMWKNAFAGWNTDVTNAVGATDAIQNAAEAAAQAPAAINTAVSNASSSSPSSSAVADTGIAEASAEVLGTVAERMSEVESSASSASESTADLGESMEESSVAGEAASAVTDTLVEGIANLGESTDETATATNDLDDSQRRVTDATAGAADANDRARDSTDRMREGNAQATRETQSAASAQRGYMTNIRDSYRRGADGAERFTRSAGLAAGSMTALKTAGSGVLTMLGGWTGAATLGISLALGAVASAHAKAADEANRQKEAEEALQATLQGAGQMTEETYSQIADALQGSGASERAQSFGLDPNLLLQAATGSDTANQALLDNLATQLVDAQASGNADMTEAFGFIADAGISTDQLVAALSKQGDSWDTVNAALEAYRVELQTQMREENLDPEFVLDPLVGSLDDLMDILPDAAESAASMNQAVADQAETAANAAEAWKDQNQTLYGTWEATEAGVAAFGALGAAITAVPNDHQVVVEVPDENQTEFMATMRELGNEVLKLPDGTIVVTANTDEAKDRWEAYLTQVASTPVTVPVNIEYRNLTATIRPNLGDSTFTLPYGPSSDRPPGGATGGRVVGDIIRGPGTGTSDSIPAVTNTGQFLRVANGESINTERSTRSNYPLIRAMNRGWVPPAWMLHGIVPGYRDGGIIGLEQAVSEMMGAPYSEGGHSPTGADCSGAMSWLANAALGLPQNDRMSTATAADWLTQRGFILSEGPAGTLRFGWYNGGPGGGHMAGTLPDGRNVEQGGSVGDFTVGGDVGADDPQFTQQAYLPESALYPEGMSSSSSSPMGYNASSGSASSVMAAQNRLADAEGDVREKEAALRAVEADADASEEDRIRAEEDLASAKRDRDQARTELTEAQNSGTDDSSSGPDGASFGRDMMSGAMEVLGLDGSVFSDPTQWGIWKLGTGLANWGAGILKNWDWDATGQSPSSGLPSTGSEASGSFLTDMLGAVLPDVGDWLPNSQNLNPNQNPNVGGSSSYTHNQNSNNTAQATNFYGPVTFKGGPDQVPTGGGRATTRATGLPGVRP